MALKLTDNEKETVLNIVNEYDNIGKQINSLVKESEDIKNKIGELTSIMEELSNKEKKILEELREKYGNFTLQEVSDAIYK